MQTAETDAEVTRGFDDIPVVEFPPEYSADLPTFLARTALEIGPIFRRRNLYLSSEGYGSWLVYMVGPEANRLAMHTQRDRFSHAMGWTPIFEAAFVKGLLNTDDPQHAHDRKLMNPAFAMAYMSRYLPIMQRVVLERTRDWVARGEVDLWDECRRITFDVAAEALVGLETGPNVDRLRRLFVAIVHPAQDPSKESHDEFVQRVMGARTEMDAILLDMIRQRRTTRYEDILDLLVSSRDEDGRGFTDTELLGQVHLLLLAAHDTTTSTMAWTLYLLATHPEYRERVLAEVDEVMNRAEGLDLRAMRGMPDLSNAIHEAGRLRTPVGVLPRGAVEDFEFAGYRVPAGSRIRLGITGGHRLPHVFADPDRYDPDRFAPPRQEDKKTPYSLVPFGGGQRICLGINFAHVQIKMAAALILSRFDIEPIPGPEPQMVYYRLYGLVPEGIHVRVCDRGTGKESASSMRA